MWIEVLLFLLAPVKVMLALVGQKIPQGLYEAELGSFGSTLNPNQKRAADWDLKNKKATSQNAPKETFNKKYHNKNSPQNHKN